MKNLLLSFSVMFCLCSVSFAQAKKSTVSLKEAKEAKLKEQQEFDKSRASTVSSTENQKDLYRKSPQQKSDLQKLQTTSKFFIIEPEQDVTKMPLPNSRKKVSN